MTDRSALVIVLTLSSILAGCSGPEAGPVDLRAAVDGLRWSTLTVYTTPSEPQELTGPVQVTWSSGLFAIWSEREPDLAHRSVVDGRTAYVNSNPGMGWTDADLVSALEANRISNRLFLWDLPRILDTPSLALSGNASNAALNVTAEGVVQFGTIAYTVKVQVAATEGAVTWARMETPQGREAPYTFVATGTAFPFPAVVPPTSLPLAEVLQGNNEAYAGHVTVVGLLEDYATSHAGTMPDEPSASSLAVELLASGESWPNNAFTQQPLAVGAAPGDIGWTKCGLGDAKFTGWGWDSALLTQNFGAGCRKDAA